MQVNKKSIYFTLYTSSMPFWVYEIFFDNWNQVFNNSPNCYPPWGIAKVFQDYTPNIKMLTSLRFRKTYLPEALNFLFVLLEVHKTYLPEVHKTYLPEALDFFLPEVFHKIYLASLRQITITFSLPETNKNPHPWGILFLVEHLPEVWVDITSLRNF